MIILLVVPLSAQTRTSFRLDSDPDAWLAPVAGVVSIGGLITWQSGDGLTAADLTTLSVSDIPAFDRWATNYSSKGVRAASDLAAGVTILLPALVLTEFGDDYWHLAGMYTETMALAWSITTMMKTSGRIRPIAYNANAPLDDRIESGIRESFPSQHTATSMAAMVFLATVYEAYHPGTTMSKVFWVGGLGLGLTTGALRIFSGMHYPSDVLVGAVIGGVIGYVVPKLHEQKGISLGVVPASSAPAMLTMRIVF